MNDNRYTAICNAVLSIPCSQGKFDLIKNHFRQGIDSARRLDRITNLNQFKRILEKRDILNTENVSPLRYIARLLEKDDVVHLIDTYELGEQEEPVLIEPVGTVRVLPEVDSDPVQRIFEVICQGIGQKWKYLARKLRIPEGLIDELDCHHSKISESVQEVLSYHRKTCDERYWRVNLCQALRDARRADLSSQVDMLCARYGLM